MNIEEIIKKHQGMSIEDKKLYEMYPDFYDCSLCGSYCCKGIDGIGLTKEDISTISEHLHITPKRFRVMYTKRVCSDHKKLYDRDMIVPCPFLKDDRCSVHTFKPEVCRKFPLQIEIDSVALTFIYSCPLATHIYEGFLEFCDKYFPIYSRHCDEMYNLNADKDGDMLTVTIPTIIFEMYIKWIVMPSKGKEQFLNVMSMFNKLFTANYGESINDYLEHICLVSLNEMVLGE